MSDDVVAMATVYALQHVFSSVARGYFPQQGRGFQTVAVSEELVGTEDLRGLEDASFYTVGRDRRAAGDMPVKETFFRLPSGRYAVGRAVNWGTDSLGREGNYLAHHLILTREDVLAAGANPFAVLHATRLAGPDLDLTPRPLPPLAVEVHSGSSPMLADGNTDPELLANLAAAAVDGGGKTALLVGGAGCRPALQGVFSVLATEERLRLTFSTHFYESHHLRSRFALVTVGSWAEAPSQRQDYLVFDLETGQCPKLTPASTYASWLADCLRAQRWEEISAINHIINGLRSNQEVALLSPPHLPTSPRACAALWERAGTKVATVLVGDAQRIIEFVGHVPSPRSLADALLAVASPSDLCGAAAPPEVVDACLSSLRSAATGKAWQSWVKQWSADPMLAAITEEPRPWWQLWK